MVELLIADTALATNIECARWEIDPARSGFNDNPIVMRVRHGLFLSLPPT